MLKEFDTILDFHGASHGHFLEYLINTWIYNGPRVKQVFTELGSSHNPQQDKFYVESKMIKCGHFTEMDLQRKTLPNKIVRITLPTTVGRWIHMVNLMHRVGDITLEKSYELIPITVLNNPVSLRTHWFSKLTDLDNTYRVDYIWKWPDVESFNFPMESLYDISELYKNMYECAKYLNFKFTPDQELYFVWNEFIKRNQGLQIYIKSKQITEYAFGNINFTFESTVIEQAVINAIITTTIGMYDGTLFTDNNYPTNTLIIWKQIENHLKEFDNKF